MQKNELRRFTDSWESVTPDQQDILLHQQNELRRFTDRWERDNPAQRDELLHHLELLLDMTRKVSSFEMLDESFDVLERIIAASTNSERCLVYINDELTGEFYLRLNISGVMRQFRMLNTEGIAGQVYKSCQPVMVNDAKNHELYDSNFNKDIDCEIHNLICCPLRTAKSSIVGVIQAVNHLDGDFKQDDLELLQNLASHAAITMESAIRADNLTRSKDEELTLLKVVSDVTTELDLTTLIQRIMAEIVSFLKAERATLFLYDPKSQELFSRVGTGIETAEIRIPCTAGIAGSVFSTGKTINIPHAYADLRFNPEVDRQTGFFTRTILSVPLIGTAGTCIGVTQVLNKRGSAFTSEDEARLKAFTAQIAIGLENANLFNDVQNIKNYNESMLHSMSSGVVTLNEEHIIVTCNDAIISMFDQPEESILGQPLQAIFGDRTDWIEQQVNLVIENQESFTAVDVDVINDHVKLSINLVIHPLIYTENEIIGTMIMVEDLSHEKRLKSTMSRYLDPTVVERLLEDAESSLGGKSAEATLLFSDIRAFTSLSEELGPQGTVRLLNNYFTEMMDCIQEQGGILDKFIGDAMMAVFGVPDQAVDDADRAVIAGIQMQKRLKIFNNKQRQQKEPEIHIGIGINTGQIVYGNIGSPKRMDFTVIGDGVNVASRLESACKYYGSKILISEFTRKACHGIYRLREVDRVILKGKHEPVAFYEVLDIYDENENPYLMEIVELTRSVQKEYRNQQWDKATSWCNKILELQPDDNLAKLYIERCTMLKKTPPAEDWNGVWVMESK